MNQKRSSSVAPIKKYFKPSIGRSQSKINGMFKSLDLSRKSSFVGLPEGKEPKRSPMIHR
jgi:hypothetical protein